MVADHAAKRPRILFPVDWKPVLEGEIMPLAAVLLNAGFSRVFEGCNGGCLSSADGDGEGIGAGGCDG